MYQVPSTSAGVASVPDYEGADEQRLTPAVATVHVTATQATIDPAPGATMTLDGVPVTEPVIWPAGGVLISGSSVFTHAAYHQI